MSADAGVGIDVDSDVDEEAGCSTGGSAVDSGFSGGTDVWTSFSSP